MQLIIINGPNLNLLGTREPSIYGNTSFSDYIQDLKNQNSTLSLDYFQSNVEGELINKLHECGFSYNGIILNAGAYTHTSIAIADAVAAIKTPVIEVHISNVFSREDYRHVSYLGKNCAGSISGFGLIGYQLAIDFFKRKNQ
jgi:3-dehydroquinate dehydratase-2